MRRSKPRNLIILGAVFWLLHIIAWNPDRLTPPFLDGGATETSFYIGYFLGTFVFASLGTLVIIIGIIMMIRSRKSISNIKKQLWTCEKCNESNRIEAEVCRLCGEKRVNPVSSHY